MKEIVELQNQQKQANLKLEINQNVSKRYDKEITELKDMIDAALNQVITALPELKKVH